MLKLVIVVKRKPGFSPQEFRDYLSTKHAAIVRECPASQKYIRKYVQSYALPIALREGSTESLDQPFDAVSELWFDSVEDIKSFFSDPDYLATVRPDESRFSDRDNCVFFVTEEKQVI
ncbi:EthD domain-containing protein [Paraburkholderia oxyphila]|uniref:EthD domain-containing protein n=1 Tax=Paraburkholderia oxyphila TaxID=614212 RepID=UPI00048A00E3|nr:EthD domain-containing protein [Paraburkholderia oxyphila]